MPASTPCCSDVRHCRHESPAATHTHTHTHSSSSQPVATMNLNDLVEVLNSPKPKRKQQARFPSEAALPPISNETEQSQRGGAGSSQPVGYKATAGATALPVDDVSLAYVREFLEHNKFMDTLGTLDQELLPRKDGRDLVRSATKKASKSRVRAGSVREIIAGHHRRPANAKGKQRTSGRTPVSVSLPPSRLKQEQTGHVRPHLLQLLVHGTSSGWWLTASKSLGVGGSRSQFCSA